MRIPELGVWYTELGDRQLTKALVERALDGGLTHHLGYECHDPAGDNSGHSRNGTTPKTPRVVNFCGRWTLVEG